SAMASMTSLCRSTTTARGATTAGLPPAAAGSPACGSGRSRSAASCTPGPAPGAGSGSPPRFPEWQRMIRVLLADDQTLVRAGFRALLDAQGDIEVAGEASDGEQAVSLAREVVPDVVLMDIRMPGTDGLAATRQIAADQR